MLEGAPYLRPPMMAFVERRLWLQRLTAEFRVRQAMTMPAAGSVDDRGRMPMVMDH